MNKPDLNNIVDEFSTLDIESKEYLVDIFYKQVTESKREKLIQSVKEAEANYKAGKVKKGSAKDLFKDINDD